MVVCYNIETECDAAFGCISYSDEGNQAQTNLKSTQSGGPQSRPLVNVYQMDAQQFQYRLDTERNAKSIVFAPILDLVYAS